MTFQQLRILNFKERIRNFATSKISVLRQEWTFSWIRLWTVMSFFSSISRVAGWCLLKTYLRKIEKHLMRDLFRENCRIVDHSLIKVKLNTDALLESLFLQQKGYHDDMKENLNFKQLQLDYINNQKQKEKKTHKISNSLYWGRCGCQNWWWGFCLKYYQNLQLHFICFLWCTKDGRIVENI